MTNNIAQEHCDMYELRLMLSVLKNHDMTWYSSKFQEYRTQTNDWTSFFKLVVLNRELMLYYTQITKTNEIINEWINDRSYHFIHNCCPTMTKNNQLREPIYIFCNISLIAFIFYLKCRLKNIDNLFSLCTTFSSIGYFIYPTLN